MEFYVKQSVCKNHLFSPSCFTDGHEAESTFGMVKRRFAPWRLYSSAECTSLPLKAVLEDKKKKSLQATTCSVYVFFKQFSFEVVTFKSLWLPLTIYKSRIRRHCGRSSEIREVLVLSTLAASLIWSASKLLFVRRNQY